MNESTEYINENDIHTFFFIYYTSIAEIVIVSVISRSAYEELEAPMVRILEAEEEEEEEEGRKKRNRTHLYHTVHFFIF